MIPSNGHKYFRHSPCEQNVRDSAKLSLQRQREDGISVVLTALMPPLQRQLEGGINVVSTTLMLTYYCLWQCWRHVSGFHFPFSLETEAYSTHTHTHTRKKELTENGNFHLFAANRNGNDKLPFFPAKLKRKYVFLGQQMINGNQWWASYF